MTFKFRSYAPMARVRSLSAFHPGVLLFALALAPLATTRAYAEAKSPSLPGVQSTLELPTEHLRNLRRAMTSGESIGMSGLRELADAGDGLAAARFAEALAEEDPVKFGSDIVHYYTQAAFTGRDFVVMRLMRALQATPDLPERRLANAENALVDAAMKGENRVAVFLSEAYAPGGLFADDPERAQQFALLAANSNNPLLAMKIALERIETGDPEGARPLLQSVRDSDDFGQAALASHLLAELDAALTVAAPDAERTENVSQ